MSAFDPKRTLRVMRSEGLSISIPRPVFHHQIVSGRKFVAVLTTDNTLGDLLVEGGPSLILIHGLSEHLF